MSPIQESNDRFAVVDVETTGVYNSDRIVEVGVVTVSMDGRIIDEWDTLVNPQRDVGPTHIHGVTPSMVSAAPTFEEVSGALGERLDGAVLVAHNLPFDSRMLANEYSRIGGHLDSGDGLCTLQATGQKLSLACEQRSIPLDNHHRALADARATARLFTNVVAAHDDRLRPAEVSTPEVGHRPRTLRREAHPESGIEMPYLARLADRTRHAGMDGGVLAYTELLDWAISDLVLTSVERRQLEELAADLGLTAGEMASVHERYVDELVAAALRDGVVDDHERRLIETVVSELGVDAGRVLTELDAHAVASGSLVLEPGMRVCFTGTATHSDGAKVSRSELTALASEFGLKAVNTVSKKGCDLLVAADPASQSGKARTARKNKLPVASVADFLAADHGSSLTVTG